MIYLILIVILVVVCFYFLYKHERNGVVDDDYIPISNVNSVKPSANNLKTDTLTSIFRIAKNGPNHFKMSLTKEGQLELLMFDIWFGIQALEARDIFLEYDDTQKRVEDYLLNNIQSLGLPLEKKYERIYLLRSVTDGWEREMWGLAQSDYPRTKQYLPAYLYMCFIEEPLKVYADEFLDAKIESIKMSDLADFFKVYVEHQNWLVSEFRKIK